MEKDEYVSNLPEEVNNQLKGMTKTQRVTGGRLSIQSSFSKQRGNHKSLAVAASDPFESEDELQVDDEDSFDDTHIEFKHPVDHNKTVLESETRDWYSVSKIYDEITETKRLSRVPKDQKREDMRQHIAKLREENAGYFRGKEFRYNNQARFFQCIEDHQTSNDGYIAAQYRPKVDSFRQQIESQSILSTQQDKDESTNFDSDYGHMFEQKLSPVSQSTRERNDIDVYQDELVVISFWRPNTNIAAA